MKSVIAKFTLAVLVIGLPLTHSVLAKANKVEVWHATDSIITVYLGTTFDVIMGHVIEVSENSINAHLGHSDVLYSATNDIDYAPVIVVNGVPWSWRDIAIFNGLNLSGVDCGGATAIWLYSD